MAAAELSRFANCNRPAGEDFIDIRSLAAHLGLSIGTVSRALNGQADVSAATRARVIEAAQALGYSPNQAGRSLRRKRTSTVAFILPLAPDSIMFGDPFFLAVLAGVQTVIEAAGLELVVLLARAEQDALGVLQRHLSRGVADAWILAATGRDDARIALLAARGTPFVTLGRSGVVADYPSIDLDFEGMVDVAMAQFLAAGHERIAIITSGPNVNFSHLVMARYEAALRDAGLAVDPDLIHVGRVNVAQCAAATTAFLALDRRPSAIFVMSEAGPVGVYASLHAAGLTPGRDVAVIGQRMTPACAALEPTLACFEVELQDLGEALGRALLSRMAVGHECAGDVTPRLWPMTFRLGDSVGSYSG